jgi:putative membrane protein
VSEEFLPALNAVLNSIAFMLLVVGYVLIRRQAYYWHAAAMVAAFVVSSIFLFFYLLHKYLHGDRGSPEELGLIRWLYLFLLLIPHVVLAMAMLPMILLTLLHAWRLNWVKHRRLAIPTFWIWLYVSISGVLVYVLLYHVFPGMIQES